METQIGIPEERILSAQRTSTDGSDDDEIPSRPNPGPSKPQIGQPSNHPRKRRINTLDTIPDENDYMGTDVLSLEYNQNHMIFFSYLTNHSAIHRISDDHRSLQVNPTPILCRKLLELSWKALSDCVVKYAHVKEASNHSKETKCLMCLGNKIIEGFKSCVEISIEHYRTIAGRELLMKSNITLFRILFLR
ncbi:hypothetical protein EAF04_006393 [Stromatinia cepivora]|nr:hypothetical protein EAF04_006393 [Stromatinia cepivora]